MRKYAVELKTGKIYTYKFEEFFHYFNNNDFLSADYNAYLDIESANECARRIGEENIKKEGI